MAKTLREAATTVVKYGNRWKVVVAAPGKGASGTYSAAILKEQGPGAIHPGTKAWIGHAEAGKRNPLDQLGKYPDGAYYDEFIDPVKYPEGALVAELEVFNRYKDAIEDIGTDAELSIYIDGDTDMDGNVISMFPSRTNSVDLVAYGGLEGSQLLEKMYESIHDSDKSSDETSALNKEKEKMDKEILDAITALKSAIDALAEPAKAKTEADSQAAVDAKVEAEVGAKVDAALAGYEEKVVAINAAELLPSQVESLKAEARKGNDVTALIESAKAVVAEFKTLKESVKSGDSFILNESATSKDDFQIRGLKL